MPLVDRSVAICICTRKRPDALARTLESVARSSHPVDLVVVSDDGHDVGTSEVCTRAAREVQYVRGPQRGLGPNRNHALRHASQDLVLFLDDDCLLGVDFLSRAIACLASNEAAYGVGRVIVSGVEKTPRQARKVPGAQTFLGFQSRAYEKDEPLTSININCTLFPSSVFARYLFDSQIRYGYDEVDIASRAARGGYTIVLCPDAVNDHRPSVDSREDYETFKTAARLYVTVKRYAMTERRYARAAAYVVLAPLHAIAAGARDGGIRGARDGASAALLALRYVRAHVAGIRRTEPDRGERPPASDHGDRARWDSIVGRALYGVARLLPDAVIEHVQHVVGRDLRARAFIRRLSAPARRGTHRIATGPATGLLIDVAGSRPSYVLGGAEADMQQFFADSIRRGDVVFDLGANVGFFTLVAAALTGPTGRVVAYEPSPQTARAVRHNVALNDLDYVTVVEAAVSDREGYADLDLRDSEQQASIVHHAGGQMVKVRTVSIDDEVERLGITPAFVKVDVEGAEAAVVAGMRDTLRQSRALVVCEIHDATEGLDGPVPSAFREARYSVSWLDGIGEDWPPHLVARPCQR